jgi:FkbM family methyltransferase
MRDRLRPQAAAQRRFNQWLSEADRLDNERMTVAMAAALRSDSNCVDVGAFTGDFFADCQRLAPDGHHIAYEPLREPYLSLTERFPGADLRQLALSNEIGETDFTHVANFPGWSAFRPYYIQTPEPAELETIRVRTTRLDDDLPTGYVPDLIKVDVNGAEELFILGAIETLRRYKPLVFLEHNFPAAEYGTTSGEIHRLLADEAGLRLFDLEGTGPLSVDGFTLALKTKWNFLARP